MKIFFLFVFALYPISMSMGQSGSEMILDNVILPVNIEIVIIRELSYSNNHDDKITALKYIEDTLERVIKVKSYVLF
jgi:hypothetical protein